MATQVPYQPDPSVAPNDRPTPYRSVDAPIAAFGGATAQALSHLGEVTSSAGNELFERANALQTLNEQAEAAEANAAYTTKLGDLHADYTTKQGKDAIDGYQPYVDATNSVRASIRDSLTSPVAQRTFDQESRNMQARAIWSGSGHLASENKSYLLGASQARMDAGSNYALSNPTDEATFQSGLKQNQSEIQAQAQLRGWSDDETKVALENANSKLYASRIQGLVKSQPFTAQKLLDQATKEGNISGQDAARLENLVTNAKNTVGARQISSDVLAGNGTSFGAGKVDVDRVMDAIGQNENSGKNVGLIHPPSPNGDHALGLYGVMSKNLAPWLAEAGMPPMSQGQFLASADAQKQLVRFKINQYMEEGGSANAAAMKWFSGSYHPSADATDGTTTVPQYLTKFNAALARGATGSDLSNAARARAKEASPNDPVFEDTVAQHVEMLHSNQLRIQREDEFNNKQTLDEAMGPDKSGKLPTSVEDITKDPKTATAWNSLNSADQAKYLRVMQSNIKNEYDWTPQTSAQFKGLVGIAKDPMRTPEETDKFLNTDIVSLPIPWDAKNQLLSMRKAMFADRTADPQMGHAMQVLAPMMNNAGIDKKSKDDYNQFVGSLHEVYQSYLDENKRKPKDDEIQAMGARLIADISTPHWYNPWSSQKMYQVDVPDQAKSAITQAYRAAHGIDPDETTTQSIYVARQYQQLYGKKKPVDKGPQPPLPK